MKYIFYKVYKKRINMSNIIKHKNINQIKSTPKQIEGSKKRKRSVNLINEINDKSEELIISEDQDIWKDYKYTDSDIIRMNFLINKYKSKQPISKKLRKNKNTLSFL